MRKCVMSLLLLVAMLWSSGCGAMASTVHVQGANAGDMDYDFATAVWAVKYNDDGDVYLEDEASGVQIAAAFRFDEQGNQIPVDLIEYKKVLEEEYKDNKQESYVNNELPDPTGQSAGVAPCGLVTTYRFVQVGSPVEVYGASIKVSPSAVGPAEISYGTSVTISDSISCNFGTNSTIRTAISVGATVAWNTSVSTSAQYTMTYSVPAGKTGYIKFTPSFWKVKGTMYQQRIQTETGDITIVGEDPNVEAQTPKKLSNGFADGVYALVLT